MAQTPPKPAGPAAIVPDRTTASFGDWILRCDRRADSTPPERICELGQSFQRQGEPGPQAQIALGRISSSEPLSITVLLPLNISMQPGPKVILLEPGTQSLALGWVRCLPTGCFANAVVSDEMLKTLRLQKEMGRLEYRDGGGRDVTVPISFRGFVEALDALSRESSK